MGYHVKALVLSSAVKAILEKLSQSRKVEKRISTRSEILLLRHQGMGSRRTSQKLSLARDTVILWDGKWRLQREALQILESKVNSGEEKHSSLVRAVVAALSDERRPGTPRKFDDSVRANIIALACEKPEDLGLPITHWTNGELAREAIKRGFVDSISPHCVGVFLKSGRFASS